MKLNSFDSCDIENIAQTIRVRGGRRFLAPLDSLPDCSKIDFPTPFSTSLQSTARITLNSDESNHAIRSLRLECNDPVSVFDPELQIEGIGRISSISKGGSCIIDLFYARRKTKAKSILLVGLAKPNVNELIVEKATEIGALAVFFYQSEFSSLRPLQADDLQKKTTRLLKIRDSALKQSYADWAPEINLYSNLEDVISDSLKNFPESTRLAGDPNAKKLCPSELEKETKLYSSVIFAIGSEGGFSPNEYKSLESSSFRRVSLGAGVLRVETAAILSLGILGLTYQ